MLLSTEERNAHPSLFALVRQTFAFFLDLERLYRLCLVPLAFCIVICAAAAFVPAWGMKIYGIPVAVFVFFMLLGAVLTLTMVKTHRLMFGEDDKKLFIPQFDVAEGRYLLNLAKITAVSVLFSSLFSVIILLCVQYFAPQILIPAPYALILLFVWTPAFMINLFAFLPASVLNEKISFKKAFSILRGMRPMFCTAYGMTAAFPFALSMSAGSFLASFLPQAGALFLQFLFFETGLLLSCVAQAVWMSYAYQTLK